MSVEIISVHFPKAAGSSLKKSFLATYGQEGVYLDYEDDPVNPICQYNIDPDECRSIANKIADQPGVKIIHGHFNPSKYDQIKNVKRVTFLRHPIDNLISIYYYWKSQGVSTHALFNYFRKNDLTLLELAHIPAIRYLMSCTYFGNTDMRIFDFIGFQESYSEDLYSLSRLLSIPISENKENTNAFAHYEEEVGAVKSNKQIMEKLHNCLIEDITFYESCKVRRVYCDYASVTPTACNEEVISHVFLKPGVHQLTEDIFEQRRHIESTHAKENRLQYEITTKKERSLGEIKVCNSMPSAHTLLPDGKELDVGCLYIGGIDRVEIVIREQRQAIITGWATCIGGLKGVRVMSGNVLLAQTELIKTDTPPPTSDSCTQRRMLRFQAVVVIGAIPPSTAEIDVFGVGADQTVFLIHAIPFQPPALLGNLDLKKYESGNLIIEGWALSATEPPLIRALDKSGQEIAKTETGIARADVAQAWPAWAGAGASGFKLKVPVSKAVGEDVRILVQNRHGDVIDLSAKKSR